MRTAVLQINSKVGAVSQNLKTIENAIRSHRADLYILPELALMGYPPRDLLSLPALLNAEEHALHALELLSAELKIGLIVGHCERRSGRGRPLYNSASLFENGQRLGTIRKQRNPSYDIFDEERFFESWPSEKIQEPLNFKNLKIGLSICEDSWDSIAAFGFRDIRAYPQQSSPLPFQKSADLLINISASPYQTMKRSFREELFSSIAARQGKPLIYANSVGGQDNLLFDGGSFFVDKTGTLRARAPLFETSVLLIETDSASEGEISPVPSGWEEIEKALEMGLYDYFEKTGHKKAVLGLSGGIDSALTAVLAVRALGAENVLGVSLPTHFTSKLSLKEARDLASRLEIEFREVPIDASVDLAQKSLGLGNKGLAFENLQSRTRGLFLMALSNAENRLLLSTGNKSELAMGYSTLYGDLCGSLLPIGDLYKTEVYGLSHWICHQAKLGGEAEPIPLDTRLRAPSAELSEGQLDTDSLPSYEILDGVLEEIIENQGQTVFKESSWNPLLKNKTSVEEIRKRVHQNEFKRFQAPPILKIHQRSFGRGWAFPLAKSLS